MVASFTDAWIETATDSECVGTGDVASFTDAWIETGYNSPQSKVSESHLLQMRGLKLQLKQTL